MTDTRNVQVTIEWQSGEPATVLLRTFDEVPRIIRELSTTHHAWSSFTVTSLDHAEMVATLARIAQTGASE